MPQLAHKEGVLTRQSARCPCAPSFEPCPALKAQLDIGYLHNKKIFGPNSRMSKRGIATIRSKGYCGTKRAPQMEAVQYSADRRLGAEFQLAGTCCERDFSVFHNHRRCSSQCCTLLSHIAAVGVTERRETESFWRIILQWSTSMGRSTGSLEEQLAIFSVESACCEGVFLDPLVQPFWAYEPEND